jgi:hypothetical protein
MPLFMDMHRKIDGLTAAGLANAHRMDLAVQERHGVQYLQYWFNEETGRVYCLIEAPNAKAARAVHREAHGLIADDITEVLPGQ